MNRLIYNDDDRLIAWAKECIGVPAFRPDACAIGQERDGRLNAVVVFDGFSTVDCNIHIASDGSSHWLTREFLTAAFAYPFIQCGLRRVTGLVPAKNVAALKFDEHLGFRREGYHPRAAHDGDLVSLGMLREWCRFIPPESRHA
ncbi:acyl-CoA N-acyltransferase [Burkholderia phage BcepMigl]|uniref:Acyl-CoA N-acyltransferase n=1 Tax=Burkholderia phage BcepMigl TaxID=2886899 RepID=I6XKW7_9CAUD|nr:acyl-CoA N-acyltransferase [Burkholderia phage BcepMigl]AFN39134.1 Acyl-CoA N-acyltransferase [Burkholderia phage BcepMigl]